MEINDLRSFYDNKQKELEKIIDLELKKVKETNNKYLAEVIEKACKDAKDLLDDSNKKANERFEKAKEEYERLKSKNYPDVLLVHMKQSAEKTLESSLKFNQTLFESTVMYCKNLQK